MEIVILGFHLFHVCSHLLMKSFPFYSTKALDYKFLGDKNIFYGTCKDITAQKCSLSHIFQGTMKKSQCLGFFYMSFPLSNTSKSFSVLLRYLTTHSMKMITYCMVLIEKMQFKNALYPTYFNTEWRNCTILDSLVSCFFSFASKRFSYVIPRHFATHSMKVVAASKIWSF